MEYLQKGFQLLSKKQKKNFFLFFFLSFITLGFELLGIGLVLPFLDIIINSEKINLYVSQINNYGLENIDNQNLVIFKKVFSGFSTKSSYLINRNVFLNCFQDLRLKFHDPIKVCEPLDTMLLLLVMVKFVVSSIDKLK